MLVPVLLFLSLVHAPQTGLDRPGKVITIAPCTEHGSILQECYVQSVTHSTSPPLQSLLSTGLSFEQRILSQQQNNAKFNFLRPNDPYHAYYRWKAGSQVFVL